LYAPVCCFPLPESLIAEAHSSSNEELTLYLYFLERTQQLRKWIVFHGIRHKSKLSSVESQKQFGKTYNLAKKMLKSQQLHLSQIRTVRFLCRFEGNSAASLCSFCRMLFLVLYLCQTSGRGKGWLFSYDCSQAASFSHRVE